MWEWLKAAELDDYDDDDNDDDYVANGHISFAELQLADADSCSNSAFIFQFPSLEKAKTEVRALTIEAFCVVCLMCGTAQMIFPLLQLCWNEYENYTFEWLE